METTPKKASASDRIQQFMEVLQANQDEIMELALSPLNSGMNCFNLMFWELYNQQPSSLEQQLHQSDR